MSAARNLAPMTPEERIARAIAAIRADLEPDPLFERRLRSQVLGRYVAVREGAAAPEGARSRKEMGRLGRAVLYASFVLGLSVTGVMAASQQAVPGDVLYPLKRDIEELRHRVLPEEFDALLLRTELTARLDELAAVTEAGDTSAMVLIADEVHRSYADVIELSVGSPQNLVVLDALLERLPEPARAAIADIVLDVERTVHPTPARPARPTGTRDAAPGGSGSTGGGAVPPGGHASDTPTEAPSDAAAASTDPSPAVQPEPSSSQAKGSRDAAPSADAEDEQGQDEGE